MWRGFPLLVLVIRLALHNRESEPSSTYHSFLPGDRVLNTKNDYHLDVFNGQCGRVLKVFAGIEAKPCRSKS
jgi:ATP-dependent exoDNAse (exonuclease V) alpha subunit